MASAQRKSRSASEQAYLRVVAREEKAEGDGSQARKADDPGPSDSMPKPPEPALPADDVGDLFRQHSHQQSMEGG